MGKIIDISGHTYNGIKVISFSHKKVKTYWNCICHCGNSFVARSNNLRNGHQKSCGCLWRENLASGMLRTHGDVDSKEYSTWCGMIARCYNKKSVGFKNYGARGIKICDRWRHSYESFLLDMGRAPSQKHSIERNNNNGDYEPSNCRWATREEQSLNKSKTLWINHNGKKMAFLTFCKENNLRYSRASYWLAKGVDSETIIKKGTPLKVDKPAAKITKLHAEVIREAVSNGHSLSRIGRYFNVTKGAIWKVKSGYTWQ